VISNGMINLSADKAAVRARQPISILCRSKMGFWL
jgi:hypothetical protein